MTMKVYFQSDAEGRAFGTGYLCRGILMEDHPRCTPLAQELVCPDGWQPNQEEEVFICRDDGVPGGPWHIYQDDREYGYCVFQHLRTEMIRPLQFPVCVEMQMGKTGPYVRLNAHPELDGRRANGKYFFPDRSWKDACAGPAMVSIAKELDSYGFLKGEMVDFEAQSPSYKEFLDWAWNEEIRNVDVFFIQHPVRGKYYALHDSLGTAYSRVCRDGSQGVDTTHELVIEDDIRDGYCQRQAMLFDLFTEDSFGVTAVDLCARFTPCKFFQDAKLDLQWQHGGKLQSLAVEDGISAGALHLWELPDLDICCVTVSTSDVVNLCTFSSECVDEMVREVAELNQQADAQILVQTRKGRIRVRGLGR